MFGCPARWARNGGDGGTRTARSEADSGLGARRLTASSIPVGERCPTSMSPTFADAFASSMGPASCSDRRAARADPQRRNAPRQVGDTRAPPRVRPAGAWPDGTSCRLSSLVSPRWLEPGTGDPQTIVDPGSAIYAAHSLCAFEGARPAWSAHRLPGAPSNDLLLLAALGAHRRRVPHLARAATAVAPPTPPASFRGGACAPWVRWGGWGAICGNSHGMWRLRKLSAPPPPLTPFHRCRPLQRHCSRGARPRRHLPHVPGNTVSCGDAVGCMWAAAIRWAAACP